MDNVLRQEGDTIKAEVHVLNELGLHARPAAKLAQEAQKFDAEVELTCGDSVVDAKSILDILSLAATQGVELEISARGEDANLAVSHLVEFFYARFGEEK